jgi:hypothetical protein
MILKIEFKKNKDADGRVKDIKGLCIHVRKYYNSPINTSYAGYTVFPAIAIPFYTLFVSLSLI